MSEKKKKTKNKLGDMDTNEFSGNTKKIRKRCSDAKHWCFTLNNYTNIEKNKILTLFNGSEVERFIMQGERGEEGTPHIQGYVEFKDKCRVIEKYGIELGTRIHWEVAKAKKNNYKACIDYCQKTDTFDGWREAKNIKKRRIRKEWTWDESKLKKWQGELLCLLLEDPDDRTIIVVVDKKGGAGKSTLTRFLKRKYGALTCDGSEKDIAYHLKNELDQGKDPDIFIADIAKCDFYKIEWGLFEKLKNGELFSGKYESKDLSFAEVHVVVFCNEKPDFTKYSMDRWHIFEIEDDKLVRKV